MGRGSVSAKLKRIATKKRWNEADGQAVVDGWHSSGLSVEAFAAQLGVGGWRVRGWVRRFDSGSVEGPPRFVQVHLVGKGGSDQTTEPPSGGVVQVELPSGLRIRIGQGVAPRVKGRLIGSGPGRPIGSGCWS
jgi:hypothetical protein